MIQSESVELILTQFFPSLLPRFLLPAPYAGFFKGGGEWTRSFVGLKHGYGSGRIQVLWTDPNLFLTVHRFDLTFLNIIIK